MTVPPVARQATALATKVKKDLDVPNPDYSDAELQNGIKLLKSCKQYVNPICGSAWTEWSAPGHCQVRASSSYTIVVLSLVDLTTRLPYCKIVTLL